MRIITNSHFLICYLKNLMEKIDKQKFRHDYSYRTTVIKNVTKIIKLHTGFNKKKLRKLEEILMRETEAKPFKEGEISKKQWSTFEIKDPELAYYISGEFSQDQTDFDNFENGLETKEYLFSRVSFLRSKEKIEAMIELFVQNENIVEGMYKCYHCGQGRTISSSKQMRRADENSTTMVTCVDCGTSWQD